MKKDLYKYNGSIEREIVNSLKEVAMEECRTLNSMVNKILKDYCRKHQNDNNGVTRSQAQR